MPARQRIQTPQAPPRDDLDGGPCCFCKRPVHAEFYCYGCHAYVCEDCSPQLPPFGRHQPKDHQ